MIDDYTRILEAVAETEDKKTSDAAVTKLILHLQSAGRMKLLPQIAHELRKIAARREANQPRVEVASHAEAAHALHAASKLGIHARKARVNASLIRGWRAQEAGKLIDQSAKQALIRIYQKAIA